MNRAARRRAAAGQSHGTDQGDSDRLHLLRTSTRQIEESYRDARRQGQADPVVVFVVDLRDPAGRELAKLDPRWGPEHSEGLERILVDYAARREIPTACLALRRPLAVQRLRHFAPGAARHIDRKAPPAGYCWVCVVARGGTLTAQYRGGVGSSTVLTFSPAAPPRLSAYEVLEQADAQNRVAHTSWAATALTTSRPQHGDHRPARVR